MVCLNAGARTIGDVEDMNDQVQRTRFENWLLGGEGVSARNVPDLDGLRGIAVLMVLLTHAWSLGGSPLYALGDVALSTLLSMLITGVELFFVLSGFLVARRFVAAAELGRPRPSLRRYARDRVFRIVPLYWFVLLLVPLVMTPWLVAESRVYSLDGLGAFVSYLPMLSALFPWSFSQFFVITPVWTLTIEVMFYALVPFTALWFARRRWMVALPASLALSLGWLAFLRSGLGTDLAVWFGSIGNPEVPGRDFGRIVLSTQLPTFAFAFAAGMTVAAVVVARDTAGPEATPPAGARWVVPAGVIVTAVTLWVLGTIERQEGPWDPFVVVRGDEPALLAFYFMQHVAPVVGFTLVLAGLVLDLRPHPIIGAAPFRVLGILGYGIYLWHFPVLFSQTGLEWMQRLDPAVRVPVSLAFGGAMVFGLSLITWFGIERPMIERGKRLAMARQETDETVEFDTCPKPVSASLGDGFEMDESPPTGGVVVPPLPR